MSTISMNLEENENISIFASSEPDQILKNSICELDNNLNNKYLNGFSILGLIFYNYNDEDYTIGYFTVLDNTISINFPDQCNLNSLYTIIYKNIENIIEQLGSSKTKKIINANYIVS